MAPPAEKKKKISVSDNRRLISSTAIGENEQQQPMGSLVTSFGKRQSVRVAQKMNKRILKKIWICTEVLMDILPFFDRPQLGFKLAMLSPRFEVLVDKHFNGKSEWTIWNDIIICKMRAKAQLLVAKSNAKPMQFRFELPDHPLPIKIRFNSLRIDYIDHSVINFLRANQHIFNGIGTNLYFSLFDSQINEAQRIFDVFARGIWPIFAPNIRHFYFSYHRVLENLRRHTSPTVLTDSNIISIDSEHLLPDSIADDGPNATAGQALAKWLQMPTKDGKPKQLSCCEDVNTSKTKRMIHNFKEAFLRATTPSASYIIRIEYFESFVPFELMNERTNEMLTLAKEKEDDYFYWLLKRCQIGQMVQWKDKKTDKLNNVSFALSADCFGPLSLPKVGKKKAKSRTKMSAGPSGQRKKK